MSKSTKKSAVAKPKKPYKDFPLFPHATKRWAKKIKGRMHYFGPWDDPDGALQKFLDEKDDLYAGRTPRTARRGELTVAELCDRFLNAKESKLNSGELKTSSYRDLFNTCKRLVKFFGKTRSFTSIGPEDFQELRAEMAAEMSVVTLKNEIGRCRMPFKFAYDQELIDRPVRYGQGFSKPTKKTLRQHRQKNAAKHGKRMFDADELRTILDALDGKPIPTDEVDENGDPVEIKFKRDPALKAMVLLGINCGFGQTDVSSLPQSAVDLDCGWVDFPRPKTAVERRVPLWPETVEAVREAIATRPRPKMEADAELCFITKYGNRWVRMSEHEQPEKRSSIDGVAQQFGKLLKSLDINGKRNFYALRHTFQTVGDEARDPVAVKSIMGHVDDSMSGEYREGISDGRLRLVVDAIRGWLLSI